MDALLDPLLYKAPPSQELKLCWDREALFVEDGCIDERLFSLLWTRRQSGKPG